MNITINNISIIGAVCGDILGSTYEWRPVKRLNHPLCKVEDEFTDDSVCTIAVADALLNGKPMARTLQEWCRRYPNAGYGGHFRRWIRIDDPVPYNSWGNGSAMRVSAAGALANSLDEALANAKASAEVSHNHPEGIKGAQAVAAAIYLAKTGKSKQEIKEYVEETFGYDLHRDYRQIQCGYTFDVSCMGSVPESIISFLVATSYEDSVRHAIAMGGDADTMAAIAGSIAAAFYKEIPQSIIQHCEKLLPQEMIEIIDQAAKEDRIGINYFYKDERDLGLIKAQLDVVNAKADRYGFERMKLNEISKTVTGEYNPLITRGIGWASGVARQGKNLDFKAELTKLSRLCKLSSDSNIITLNDGRQIECFIAENLKERVAGESDEARKLFHDNILRFIEHSEEILNDSRMFLTPIYSQSFSPFFGRPTLGAFVEWWKQCVIEPVERNGYPICSIAGNPQTGSNTCWAVKPDGTLVKADVIVSFIDLLNSFGKINGRYRYLSEFCQTYALQEVIDRLKNSD